MMARNVGPSLSDLFNFIKNQGTTTEENFRFLKDKLQGIELNNVERFQSLETELAAAQKENQLLHTDLIALGGRLKKLESLGPKAVTSSQGEIDIVPTNQTRSFAETICGRLGGHQSNPAGFKIDLVHQIINRDRRLCLEEFRPSALRTTKTTYSMGPGMVLSFSDGDSKKFLNAEDLVMAVRNFLNVILELGHISVTEIDMYAARVRELTMDYLFNDIAKAHDSFRCELINKDSWNYGDGLPERFVNRMPRRPPRNPQTQGGGNTSTDIKCHLCQKPGHIKRNCPDAQKFHRELQQQNEEFSDQQQPFRTAPSAGGDPK